MLVASPARADPQPTAEQWAVSPDTVLDLPGAWALSQGAGVVVAVVDSGVAAQPPRPRARTCGPTRRDPGQRDDDDGNGYVDDVHGVDLTGDEHSATSTTTGTAPTSPGRSRRPATARGVVGVAYRAKLMTVQVLDARGVRHARRRCADGIRYAAANGARIINLSLETPADDPRVRAAVAGGGGRERR